MIKLTNASKSFRADRIKTTALNSINLSIDEGEFVSIMGPSGCGKSTLLNTIGMFESLDAGKYEFFNQDIQKLSRTAKINLRRNNLSYIFQSFNLIPHLSVIENIELPLIYRGYKKSQRRKIANSNLEKLSLTNRAKHKPYQLSGGQQQRVAIARAISTSPKVILADEPTGNLDSSTGEVVLKLLQEINKQGTTILMVTHSHEASEFSARTINMLDGKIISA